MPATCVVHPSRDCDLERRVRSFFVEHGVPAALDLEIEADRGVVRLSGEVDSPDEKWQCETLARHVAGVVKLINGLGTPATNALGI